MVKLVKRFAISILLGLALWLLPLTAVAGDHVVFTTLGCGNSRPSSVVIYEIHDRYPTVQELLDFENGAVHEIDVQVDAMDERATERAVKFLLAKRRSIKRAIQDRNHAMTTTLGRERRTSPISAA